MTVAHARVARPAARHAAQGLPFPRRGLERPKFLITVWRDSRSGQLSTGVSSVLASASRKNLENTSVPFFNDSSSSS